jgi:hypothetical protein
VRRATGWRSGLHAAEDIQNLGQLDKDAGDFFEATDVGGFADGALLKVANGRAACFKRATGAVFALPNQEPLTDFRKQREAHLFRITPPQMEVPVEGGVSRGNIP